MRHDRDERRAGRHAARDARRVEKEGRHAAKADKKRAVAQEHLDLLGPDEPATPQARGYESCPCPKDCTLHGECLLCVAYHGRNDVQPRCLR